MSYSRLPGEQSGAARVAGLIRRHRRSGRVVDIGCGDGDFLLAMQGEGWEVSGLDPDPGCVARCRARGLSRVSCGDALSIEADEGSFDVVTMWNVLEHLHDPLAVLQMARRFLREDGILALKVPNSASWQARVFGPCWVGYDLPWHLYHFDAGIISRMLGQAGIDVVEVKCLSGSYDAFVRSLLAVGRSRGAQGRRAATYRFLATSPFTRAVVKPLNLLLDCRREGAILTVVGRVQVAQMGSP